MRVVSLLPAATDWLVAIGAERQLVGRTHLCDASEVAQVPVITKPHATLGTTVQEIDASVRGVIQVGLSPFVLDLDRLDDLRPDLIVTQTVCGVCAPSLSSLTAALAAWTGVTPGMFDFAPATHKQVLDAALELAARIGQIEAAMAVIAESEARLRTLAERIGGRQRESGPTVVCMEWVDPPMTAGHWTPGLVEHAGGRPLLSVSGERSRYTSWAEVAEADPDVLVVSACGRSVPQSLADLTASASSWRSLRAVEAGRATVLDGNRLFNRPGPALTRSTEVMAWALWGDASGVEVHVDEAAPFPRVPEATSVQ